MTKYKEIDMRKLKTYSIHNRKSIVAAGQLAKTIDPGSRFGTFLESLPSTLAAEDLKSLVADICRAVHTQKPVLWMMGAHVIKVGLSPIIIDLMKRGVIQGIALNGAGAIHDLELAYFGKTSEDVATSLKDGRFGMVSETADLLNTTIQKGKEMELGFGEALGKRILEDAPEYNQFSILGQAYQLDIPVTVHVALGTDIVHQHPSADGASIGELSLRDFRIWCRLVSRIGEGGVVLVIGSAVILPEVFLKALTVARNSHSPVNAFTTANFDMIRHYRPRVNVIERPTQDGGRGFTFLGHHEIMIPFVAAAIKETLQNTKE
jgi:hypothetical protein